MAENILILTEPDDVHAHAVALSLRQRGVGALLWYTTDFPQRTTESLLFEGGGLRQVQLSGVGKHDLASYGISRVWRRRPALVLDPSLLHPADRQFAESECAIFRHSLFSTILSEAFWVNPPDAALRAGRKPIQHRAASEVGLSTPDTLYSNDPEKVRAFIRRQGGQVVYKTFRPFSWRNDETSWMPYTSILTEDLLVSDALLQATPGIFQALVPKAYELRVTVIGRRPFAAKVLSQETIAGKLDWRKAYGELRIEPCGLPRGIAEGCNRLMEQLGLVFGCFDFIVTPDQKCVFLEVNEMGQFLFVEFFTGLPLLDAFSEFLSQGNVEFSWDEEHARIRYTAALEAEALALVQQAKAEHVGLPDPSVREDQDAAQGVDLPDPAATSAHPPMG
jgi:hypothetical protein